MCFKGSGQRLKAEGTTESQSVQSGYFENKFHREMTGYFASMTLFTGFYFSLLPSVFIPVQKKPSRKIFRDGFLG